MPKSGITMIATFVGVLLVGLGAVLVITSGHRQRQEAPAGAAVTPDDSAVASGTPAQAISWHHAFSEAVAEAKTRKTLIVVDAYADWCMWCKKMDQDTFTNAEVQRRLREFAVLKLDTDKEPELAQRYNISGLPTTLILDVTEKVVISHPGYLSPQEYLQILAQAKAKQAY